jgi:hypothetical protein
MLIGINGKIGSGKDTVGKIIQHLTSEWDTDTLDVRSDWKIKKFAGKLKQIASLLTGINVEKFEDQEFKNTTLSEEWDFSDDDAPDNIMTVRMFLQKLGTEAMRDGLHTNVWVNALFADYTDESKWCITDMRFPNEMKAVEDRGGITIRIERGGSTNQLGNLHPSETALDDATFDYVIYNNGTMEELIKKVREILMDENIL